MEWVEVTARTVDEAKELALDQLGVDEQEAEFEVVEEPKAGLFGRLRSEARVRARIVPAGPRPKVDRRRRQGRGRERGGAGEAQGGESGSPRRGGRGRGSATTAVAETRSPRPRGNDGPDQGDAAGGEMTEPTLAEEADAAVDFLEGLLGAFGRQGQVEHRTIDDETVEVAIVGDDLGLLIGPKGQTLSAIQDLTRTAVQRRLGGRSGRLLVDVAGYREKRRAALERFTRQEAEKVLATSTPSVLDPMAPADRKVVHDTVNEIPGVATSSEGEEPRRRVVIRPEGPGA